MATTTTTRVSTTTMDRFRDAVVKARGAKAAILPEVEAALDAHAELLEDEAESGLIRGPALPDLTKPFLASLCVKAKRNNEVRIVIVAAPAACGKTESSERLAHLVHNAYVTDVSIAGTSRPVAQKLGMKWQPKLAESFAAASVALASNHERVQILVIEPYMGGLGRGSSAMLDEERVFAEAVDAFRNKAEGRTLIVILATQEYKIVTSTLRSGSFVLYKGHVAMDIGGVDQRGRDAANVLVRRLQVEHEYDSLFEWVVAMPGYRAGKVTVKE